MNSLTITLFILVAAVIFCFFGGLITRNYSHVDRLWSVLPPVYVLVWLKDFYNNPRFVIAAVLVVLWGARLTTNFAIKGGYAFSWKKGFYGEDYRWDVMRGKIPNRFLFELFNLFFISLFQQVLIFFFTLPVYFLGTIVTELSSADFLLFAAHFVLLAVETVADIQQLKYYRQRGDKEFSHDSRIQLGFNTYGLWKYSRHPNYVCEVGQWIVVYFYLHIHMGWHFAGAGVAVLIALFAGSIALAESITASKYPAYKNWQRMTSPWIPGLFYLPDFKSKESFLKQ